MFQARLPPLSPLRLRHQLHKPPHSQLIVIYGLSWILT